MSIVDGKKKTSCRYIIDPGKIFIENCPTVRHRLSTLHSSDSKVLCFSGLLPLNLL